MPHMGKILEAIWQSGLQIIKMKMTILEREEADEFYKERHGDQNYK